MLYGQKSRHLVNGTHANIFEILRREGKCFAVIKNHISYQTWAIFLKSSISNVFGYELVVIFERLLLLDI